MKTEFSLSQATVLVVHAIRPDWDNAGIEKAIREALDQGNPPPDIIRAITAAALTPKVKTPRGFLYARELWAASAPQASARVPECSTHIGKPAHNCGECRAELLAAGVVKSNADHTPIPHLNGTPCPPELRKQLGLKPAQPTT